MKTVEMPLCLGGYIAPTTPSFCMDDATHVINTPIVGSIRIKPANEAVREALEKYAEKDIPVTVCGCPRSTVNCHHIEAYYVAEAEESVPKLRAL
ncbi:MAG: hypothetical protein Kow0032_04180 [Methyloligellaceae bacterium]